MKRIIAETERKHPSWAQRMVAEQTPFGAIVNQISFFFTGEFSPNFNLRSMISTNTKKIHGKE
jgi:hypothetical protein